MKELYILIFGGISDVSDVQLMLFYFYDNYETNVQTLQYLNSKHVSNFHNCWDA